MSDGLTANGSARTEEFVNPLFECEICGGTFDVGDVWYVEGQIICKACHAKASGPTDVATTPDSPAKVAGTTPKPARQLQLGSLLLRITCPHCWHRFTSDQILWISEHTELLGDPVLGSEAASRFLPTRFTVAGGAIDARGMECQVLACPKCHLVVPRSLTETEPLFISIVGVPASGKSYFLTAMTWQARRRMPEQFAVIFNDADTVSNRILNEYEELLFLQPDASRVVAIRKTEVHGVVLYDQIRLGEQIVSLPRPFLFSFKPAPGHPNFGQATKVSRVLCMYDNAGEAFDPGEDSSTSPVTQHLSKSRVLMFLFDPTQDARIRAKCREFSSDPQLDGRARRQETILLEMVSRIRRYVGLASQQRYDRPLIVIVPKADVWGRIIDLDITEEPLIPSGGPAGKPGVVDLAKVESISARVRNFLFQFAPEFVMAAEDFCQNVIYIPVSALGHSPMKQDGQEGLLVRPADIRPMWVTVPMLYMFAKWSTGLIGGSPPPVYGPVTTAGVASVAAR